jgi:sugar/nucleoside kinase (ribokinase family)
LDLTIPLAMLVCTLGDLTLDVVVRLAGPVATGGDTDASIHVGPGGQAANVAAWVAALGAGARFVGRTGADDAGDLVRSKLGALGVEIAGPVGGRNGTICSLVAPDGERSMASDRGAATELGVADLEPAWFACDHLHVSGYALMLEPVRSAALRAVELARAAGARVSVDLASWSGIRDSGVEGFRETVRVAAPDVVFANDEEVDAVGPDLVEALWIVKHGAHGCSFGGVEREAPGVSEVLDSTGAGDALAAGWIVGGPDLALEAAARCVEQVGAMPITSQA